MPIYEYICTECGCKFEVLHRAGQADGAACPRCHAGASRKFSTFASFSRSGSGESTPVAGTGSFCGSCSSSSCSTCGM
ncbi:MAG: zinc ribbon domain-containing protein [Chloroflexi bacterium]|nr:zinc ribbon domain-containing protein [Chloroflexota bacterium]